MTKVGINDTVEQVTGPSVKVDPRFFYVLSKTTIVFSLKKESGKIIWQKNIFF